MIEEPPSAPTHAVRHQRPAGRAREDERGRHRARRRDQGPQAVRAHLRARAHHRGRLDDPGRHARRRPGRLLDEAERDRRRLPRPGRGPHPRRPRRRRRRVGVLARRAQVEDRRPVRDPQHGPDARDRQGAAGAAGPDRRARRLRACRRRGDAGRSTRSPSPSRERRASGPIPDAIKPTDDQSPSSTGCSPSSRRAARRRLAGARPRDRRRAGNMLTATTMEILLGELTDELEGARA